MNAMQYALNKIHLLIPDKILAIAFKDPDPVRDQLVGIDDKIMTNLIRPHILVDMNITGGIPIKVDLSLCQVTWIQSNEYLIVVPKSLTNGQTIVSVQEFVNANVAPTFTMAYTDHGAPLMTAANTMYNNLSPSNVMQTSRLEILGENRILLSDPSVTPLMGVLRCTIAHNSNLENIQPQNFHVVARLFELGVKSYIHNAMSTVIDQGYLYGGHELSAVKDVIDSYADAHDQYVEYLNTVWRKTSFLNSPDNTARYVKLLLGNNI